MTRVDADHLTLIGVIAGLDEELAAVGELDHRERSHGAGAVTDQRSGMPGPDLAGPWPVPVEHRVGDAGAAGQGEEVGAEADEPAAGHDEVHPNPSGGMVGHLFHPPLTGRHQLGDRPDELLGTVDGHRLERLMQFAVDGAGDDLGLADRQLETFAAHLLDEDGQRQFTAALHLPGVRSADVDDLDRYVADQFGVQSRLHHPRGQLVARHLACQRRRVGADGHRDRRLVDGDPWQGVRMVGVGEGVADHDLGHTRDGDDIPRDGLIGRAAVDTLGGQQFGDLGVGDDRKSVDLAHPGHLLALAQPAVVDPDERQAAEERRGVQVRHQRLQWRLRIALRRRDVLKQDVEQWIEVVAFGILAIGGFDRAGHSGTPGCVQRRKSEGVFGGLLRLGVQIGGDVEQQVVTFRDDLGNSGVRTVGLIHHQDHRQVGGQCLPQHEASLWQWAFGGVD